MFAPFNLRRFVGELSDIFVLTGLELVEDRMSLFINARSWDGGRGLEDGVCGPNPNRRDDAPIYKRAQAEQIAAIRYRRGNGEQVGNLTISCCEEPPNDANVLVIADAGTLVWL